MSDQTNGCGDDRCHDCGCPIDPMFALVEGFSEVMEGHDLPDIIGALCFTLGEVMAMEPAETRAKLRRQVGADLTRATKYHVIQNCDA